MLLDAMKEIENRYGLYTDRIDDVPYWMLIRFDVMQYYVLVKNMNMEKSYIKEKIIYKLHPSEIFGWKEKYDYFDKDDNIEVIDSNNKNIYECFSISSVQIGAYSTALYEGLGFGLKTMVYEIGHQETVDYLIAEGYAVKVLSAYDIVEELDNLEANTSINGFWKENSKENIVEYLRDEIIGRMEEV